MRTRTVGAALLALAAIACGGSEASFYQISLNVGVSGNGSGTVEPNDDSVGLDCTIVNGSDPPGCADTFQDAGEGGTFTLTATPTGGSVFTSWSGCTSVSGPVCTLSFSATAGDTTFSPVVTFTAGESDAVTLYNGSLASAYLLAPGESATAGNLLAPNATRSVVVGSAVGSAIVFRAVVGAAQVAQTTCTVTAAAWEGTGQPLVGLFGDGGYSLTCNGF